VVDGLPGLHGDRRQADPRSIGRQTARNWSKLVDSMFADI
jgi:hypothetical protein